MKLALSWIFDHIDADYSRVDVASLVAAFNRTTAEIESYYQIALDTKSLFLAVAKDQSADRVSLFCPELKKDIQLAPRSDVVISHMYLVKKHGSGFTWATSSDLGASKEFVLPALSVSDEDLAGGWKNKCAPQDWIIEVDNKSINHRPDLWSHRGIARELAVILDKKLRPLDQLIAQYPVQEEKKSGTTGSFSVSNTTIGLCSRFAGVQLAVNNNPSLVPIALRLVRIDSRPIDAIVDLTNYVMFDVGQPLHAFDAGHITTGEILVRDAKKNEKIILLDGQQVELVAEDIVVTDGKQPIALGGIMGGLSSAVSAGTSSIFLEAAHFDPAIIRRTAARVRKRSDASARFEKNIDPTGNVVGIQRFLKLSEHYHLIKPEDKNSILSLGEKPAQKIIQVEHAFIESRLAIGLDEKKVIDILQKLDFSVTSALGKYTIVVPSFRATKDISIPEDIVEEVARIVGFEHIPAVLPRRFMAPFHLHAYNRTKRMKEILAYGCRMREVYNYALFDQEFLSIINYTPTNAARVLLPVSENWSTLVTSLIPGLLKNVHDNAAQEDHLRFFESARVWNATQDHIHEHKKIAGILFDKKHAIDFYGAKAELEKLFHAIGLHITYKKAVNPEPWFDVSQTAVLLHKDKQIGVAGRAHQSMLHKITLGDAFIFELDGNFMLDYSSPEELFKPLNKYQPVERDISMLVSTAITVDQVLHAIRSADIHIVKVELLDVFHKAEWKDQKSIACKFIISDPEKSLSKQETEAIWQQVANTLKKLGAHIR